MQQNQANRHYAHSASNSIANEGQPNNQGVNIEINMGVAPYVNQPANLFQDPLYQNIQLSARGEENSNLTNVNNNSQSLINNTSASRIEARVIEPGRS
mmetsp:Transcript_41605/g.63494  ORF Transcript_41605/g.63494 Transcript_41605/m.63494 type:complete len:98 (+) Transcript_41605:292-585(+)